MFKKFLRALGAGLLISSLCSSIALAENPAAQKYRDILKDGSFILKYSYKPCDDKGRFFSIPFIGSYESVRTVYSRPDKRVANDDGMSRLTGNAKKYSPTYIYMKGNYYFISGLATKKEISDWLPLFNTVGSDYKSLHGTMLPADEFSSYDFRNINTRDYSVKDKKERRVMGLRSAYDVLPIPESLSPLYDDPLLHSKYNIENLQFAESFKKKVKDKEYDCDRYIAIYTAEDGGLIDEVAYELYYDKDKLVMSRNYSIKTGEIMRSQSKYEEISDTVPDGVFDNKLPIEVFALGGDNIGAALDDFNETFVEVIEATGNADNKKN